MLSNRIDFESCDVLDLFAGTGAIGLEFVSRGARTATSVDNQGLTLKFIHEIIAKLGIENWNPVKSDAKLFCQKTNLKFDVIFADPPFDDPATSALPALIFEHNLLKNNGILIIEHDKNNSFENTTHFSQLRKYGGVHFSVFILP